MSQNPFWNTSKGAARANLLQKRLTKLGSLLKSRGGKTPKGKTPFNVLANRYQKLATKVASHGRSTSSSRATLLSAMMQPTAYQAEHVPTLRGIGVAGRRRGRPKGSKNKPKSVSKLTKAQLIKILKAR